MIGQAKAKWGLDTGVEDNFKSKCGDTQLRIVHIFSTFNINHLQIHTDIHTYSKEKHGRFNSHT
jgi:hypothetical protein